MRRKEDFIHDNIFHGISSSLPISHSYEVFQIAHNCIFIFTTLKIYQNENLSNA